jgi:hypothetical protein
LYCCHLQELDVDRPAFGEVVHAPPKVHLKRKHWDPAASKAAQEQQQYQQAGAKHHQQQQQHNKQQRQKQQAPTVKRQKQVCSICKCSLATSWSCQSVAPGVQML